MNRLLPGVVCTLLATAALTARDSGAKASDAGTRTSLVGSSVGCMDGQHVSLGVALAIVSPRAEPFAQIIREEVTALWHRHGVALQWTDVASLRALDDGVLRLVVQEEELSSFERGPRYSVGWIRFVAGRPQNVVRVSRRTALAYVRRLVMGEGTAPMEGLLDEPKFHDVFARLLAWSLAHEIGHYVLATPRHTNTGLMRVAFLADDLIRPRESSVSLAPVDAARLRAWASGCRSASVRTPR